MKIFYSYSHKDNAFRGELEKHLTALQEEGLITSWHDGKIIPSEEWDESIKKNLKEAEIILFLVSQYFLDSDYINRVEVKRAMERHETRTARVIPIILSDCPWQDSLFGKIEGLPKKGKPISMWNNMEDAFSNVAVGIRQVCSELKIQETDNFQFVGLLVEIYDMLAELPNKSNDSIKLKQTHSLIGKSEQINLLLDDAKNIHDQFETLSGQIQDKIDKITKIRSIDERTRDAPEVIERILQNIEITILNKEFKQILPKQPEMKLENLPSSCHEAIKKLPGLSERLISYINSFNQRQKELEEISKNHKYGNELDACLKMLNSTIRNARLHADKIILIISKIIIDFNSDLYKALNN